MNPWRDTRPLMILVAILFLGILTMWIPARWALSAFQVAIFALAAFRLMPGIVSQRRPDQTLRRLIPHPVGALLGAAAAWGLLQLALDRSVYRLATWEAILIWTTNLAAFLLAFDAGAIRRQRERLLQAILIFTFVLGIVATFTLLTSPAGKVFWTFPSGSDGPTLGPFVYRNQYASFVEAVLPLAIVRAILDRRRTWIYTLITAALFASVVAGGSRTGTFLCLGEILAVPVLAFAQGVISRGFLARVVLGSVAAVILLTAVVGFDVIWTRLQEPNPYSVRRQLLESSLEMTRDRPLMGFGLGTWSTAYPGYAHFDNGTFVNQAHNDWAQWAAEGGLPFFAILAAIAIWAIRPALRSLWGIGILAVLLHCFLDYPMQQRPALAAFFFAILGFLAASDRES